MSTSETLIDREWPSFLIIQTDHEPTEIVAAKLNLDHRRREKDLATQDHAKISKIPPKSAGGGKRESMYVLESSNKV